MKCCLMDGIIALRASRVHWPFTKVNVQMDCLNDENIKKYFDMLKETLLENYLMDKHI